MQEIRNCFKICQEKGLPIFLVINAYLNAKYKGGEKKPNEISGAMIIGAFYNSVNKYKEIINSYAKTQ